MTHGTGPEGKNAPAQRGWPVLLLGTGLGGAAFLHYFLGGMTTAHYDAKAHLVVARRIVDSLEPGYMQLGGHWLPLLHVLYLPFVLIDSQYRSGLIPSLISVTAFALSGWLAFRIALRATGLPAAGWFAAIMLLANPNLLYLQSCPLTEPVALALLLGATDALMTWRASERESGPWVAAFLASLGALCRYEGWVFLAGVLILLWADAWWKRMPWARALRAAAVFAALFAGPLVLHFGYIYLRLRDGFLVRVARGNPAPYETFHHPLFSLAYHAGELLQIASVLACAVGVAGVCYGLMRRDRMREWLPLALLWTPSLINVAALYWGHIYRVRYSVLLLPAVAICGSLLLCSERAVRRTFTTVACLAILLPWLAWYFPAEWRYRAFQPGPGILLLPASALVLFLFASASGWRRWPLLALSLLGMHLPVLRGELKPIMSETLEHAFIEPEREQVLRVLRAQYDSTRILVDMGKLAPLVYDSGLPVREFVYNEGWRRRWDQALRAPGSQVGWLCLEKGDEFWNALQIDPRLTDGYALAVHTDNLLLFRLTPEKRQLLLTTRRLE